MARPHGVPVRGAQHVAHRPVGWLLAALGLVLPGVLPAELAAPVGWLVALTAVLVLTEVAQAHVGRRGDRLAACSPSASWR
jgi:hypothetical protein